MVSMDVSNPSEIPVLATLGEYTMYPLEYCGENQVATLFTKICQRGNPVLQGRPIADLELLGRAMYRKSNILRLGQVAVHKGEPVALSFNWDVAQGGVWQDSGLEMPVSLAAHAAAGKASFESLKARGSTFFIAFVGVVAPHPGALISWFGVSSTAMAQAMGFQDLFMFSLIAALKDRAGIYQREQNDFENHWQIRFADIDSGSAAVSAELKQLDKSISCSLIDLNHALGDDYMTAWAATCRMKTADELRQPAELMAKKQLNWLKQTQSTSRVTSRL